MRARDPDDVHVLALSLHLELPVWTNDDNFEDSGVEWHTTAELLELIGIRSR
jgi:predicted nucleic acid-binding protein